MSAPINQTVAAVPAPALPVLPSALTTSAYAYRGTGQATELAALPLQRNIDLRPARALHTSNNITTRARPAYVEAAMAQAVGSAPVLPCSRCDDGLGNFVSCIVVGGERDFGGGPFLHGACANCHFGDRSMECSFRLRIIREDQLEAAADEEREKERETRKVAAAGGAGSGAGVGT